MMILGTAVSQGAQEFRLWSADIPPGGDFPAAYVLNRAGCTGGNLSPALQWTDPPAGTKSFAITLFDPDEKVTGSGWWHWVVYDIPASSRTLVRGAGIDKSSSLPFGTVQGRSDLGTAAYHGPCPEIGESHQYVFTIYALKTEKLRVDPSATPAMVRYVLNEFILGRASFSAALAR